VSLPERILIVRLSHLGDVVHALGVFHALHEAYPAAEIGWAIQPEFAELVAGLPGLVRVLPFERRAGWRAWPLLVARLREFRPDLVVDAQANLKSAAVTWCARAPRRAGLARRDWREPLGERVLNDPAPALPLPAPDGRGHAMDRMLALARHVAPAASHPPRRDAGLSERERAEGERELDARLPGAGEDAVLVHLSSPGDVRAWSAEGWEALARALAERGRPTLSISGPAEEPLGRALAARLQDVPGAAHWIGQRGLRRLAALFEAAAARGARLVACDSGPLHLAAASGLRVVALEGPQDARRTGPWPRPEEGPHRVARAADPPACAPCLARACTHPEGPVCMLRIDARELVALL
jgi:ADP-heptose:LPS heptosyltransferase